VTGAFPDQCLVHAGDDLDGLGLGAVPGHRAQLVGVGADHIGQQVGIGGVALGTREPTPFPVAGGLQRVHRQHRVAGGHQRLHPWAAVGLNPDHHLHVLIGDIADLLSDHRVQPGHAGHPFRQPRPGQSPPEAPQFPPHESGRSAAAALLRRALPPSIPWSRRTQAAGIAITRVPTTSVDTGRRARKLIKSACRPS